MKISNMKRLALGGMLLAVSGCAHHRNEVDIFEEKNSKPVALTPEGAKVVISDISPKDANKNCDYIEKIGNPGIREINADKNDFRNRAAEKGGNYVHYLGLQSTAAITHTLGMIYKCK